jgi:hypothetical protein
MKRSTILTTSAALLLVGSLANAQGDRGRGRGRDRDDKKTVPPQEQQQRVDEQRQRDSAYKMALANQVRTARQTADALQQQKRTAQYTANQQYMANLQQQQERLRNQRPDPRRDPYYAAPMTFRYRVGSTDRQTNQYGVDVMRQAVNNGYEQGFKAGRADRRDRWTSNYRDSYGYQDANYGYSGNYLPQSDYNYYFREGFQRGYQDGYARQSQYGTVVNGSPSILGNILSAILGLHSIS